MLNVQWHTEPTSHSIVGNHCHLYKYVAALYVKVNLMEKKCG